jgi:hypothetical protein
MKGEITLTPNEMPPVGTRCILTIERTQQLRDYTITEKGTIVKDPLPNKFISIRPYWKQISSRYDLADIISCKVGW